MAHYSACFLALFLLLPTAAYGFNEDEFPFLGTSPYPMQHVNPRAAGHIETTAPLKITKVWEALTDSTLVQPCSSGTNGLIYCVLAWDLASDKCNLRAPDAATGVQVWEDRISGDCLLDEEAHLTNPTIDIDGNLYVGDSSQIASFTADGVLRWSNPLPSLLPSSKGPATPPSGSICFRMGTW